MAVILTHLGNSMISLQSGLPYLDAQISEEMALDHNLMRGVLEAEAPKYPPGRSTGYHAFTYGWLADQIVRHTDEKHRGIGQFLREEIAKPNGRQLSRSATSR